MEKYVWEGFQELIKIVGYDEAKRRVSSDMRHDLKKKFLNIEEALWWATERGFKRRAYACPKCPFIHLTSIKKWY